MTTSPRLEPDTAVMGALHVADQAATLAARQPALAAVGPGPGGTEEPPTRDPRSRARHRASGAARLRTVVSWVLLALAVVALWPAQFGGLTGLTIVHGASMEPTYATGDVVVTLRTGSYQVGDVISYTVPAGQAGAGGHVIHRVGSVEPDGTYTTIGDNSENPDEWVIADADVRGKAVAVLPRAGIVFSPQVLPYVVALAVGGIVTLLLWRTDDDETDSGGESP
ncbi:MULTISPECIES: signal peptidase I [unclassified Pseudactinotalea]|uniref:signal peptidase I n=1 Tax=Micrococcales TaxID=85006 RepID=UPI003C7EA5CF